MKRKGFNFKVKSDTCTLQIAQIDFEHIDELVVTEPHKNEALIVSSKKQKNTADQSTNLRKQSASPKSDASKKSKSKIHYPHINYRAINAPIKGNCKSRFLESFKSICETEIKGLEIFLSNQSNPNGKDLLQNLTEVIVKTCEDIEIVCPDDVIFSPELTLKDRLSDSNKDQIELTELRKMFEVLIKQQSHYESLTIQLNSLDEELKSSEEVSSSLSKFTTQLSQMLSSCHKINASLSLMDDQFISAQECQSSLYDTYLKKQRNDPTLISSASTKELIKAFQSST